MSEITDITRLEARSHARVADSAELGGSCDAIAEDIVVVDDDVSRMDAGAELDPDFLRNVGVLRG